MRNIRGVVLTLFAVTLGSMAALAQTGNTAYGDDALNKNHGSNQSAFGFAALFDNDQGSANTAVGAYSLYYSTTAADNAAVGVDSLYSDTSGSGNAAVGFGALDENTTGGGNTAIGASALLVNTTGGYNIGIGYNAGLDNPAGASNNIDIGSVGSSSDSKTIRIGTPSTQTSFYAAGIDGVTVSSGVEVYINSSGQLGTVNSSRRFKENVLDMGDASSAIFRLRPVTYRYKQPYTDGSKPVDYGLIAEEVAEVYPDLVVRGADGQIQTVQYQKLTPMLLNELQKQHQLLEQMGKTVEQQQQTMAQQEATIQLLKARQTETVQLLEKRLAALEAEQPSAGLEARVATQ